MTWLNLGQLKRAIKYEAKKCLVSELYVGIQYPSAENSVEYF